MRCPTFISITTAIAFAMTADTAFALAKASAPEHWHCPVQRIGLFDNQIALAPRSTEKALSYWNLFSATSSVARSVFQLEPNRSSLQFLDGAVAQAIRSDDPQVLSSAMEYANYAPAGPVPGFDYLLLGRVAGSENNYRLELSLEDATTREKVAGTTALFSKLSEAQLAGEAAATELGSLFSRIYAFQKNKRNSTSDNAAIHASIRITPETSTARPGQAVALLVELYDCDAEPGQAPLAGRMVRLSATGGTVEPSQVMTDYAGRAKATLVPHGDGTLQGLATVRASFGPYADLNHRIRVATGHAGIAVEAARLWRLEAWCSHRISQNVANCGHEPASDSDCDKSFDEAFHGAHITALLKGTERNNALVAEEIVSVLADGEHWQRASTFQSSPLNYRSQREVNALDGRIDLEGATIRFVFDPLRASSLLISHAFEQRHEQHSSRFSLRDTPPRCESNALFDPAMLPWSWNVVPGRFARIERRPDGSYRVELNKKTVIPASYPEQGEKEESWRVQAVISPIR